MKGMKFSNLPTSLHSDIAHLREASGPGETQQGSFYFFGERERKLAELECTKCSL